MSWSTISFGSTHAHAHDWEQVLFMSLAPACLNSCQEFRDVEWLHKWKDCWVNNKGNQGNGCSDIELNTHLDSEEKILAFRSFLNYYLQWIRGFGAEIPIDIINGYIDLGKGMYMTKPCQITELEEFVAKIIAVLDGNTKHPAVW